MGMPFEEVALTPPTLAGLSGDRVDVSEPEPWEAAPSDTGARRQPILAFVMSIFEAWPQSAGPFFTADGQSATFLAQAQADR